MQRQKIVHPALKSHSLTETHYFLLKLAVSVIATTHAKQV